MDATAILHDARIVPVVVIDDVDTAIPLAETLVSCGLDAAAHEMPFIPGAITASEMIRLLERGYTLQKFFPAELAGGSAMLRAIGSPIPDVRFFPTGGISAELADDYLALGNVACVGGSWIAPGPLLGARDFNAIARLATEAARAV